MPQLHRLCRGTRRIVAALACPRTTVQCHVSVADGADIGEPAAIACRGRTRLG
jgi:hypothetical protein